MGVLVHRRKPASQVVDPFLDGCRILCRRGRQKIKFEDPRGGRVVSEFFQGLPKREITAGPPGRQAKRALEFQKGGLEVLGIRDRFESRLTFGQPLLCLGRNSRRGIEPQRKFNDAFAEATGRIGGGGPRPRLPKSHRVIQNIAPLAPPLRGQSTSLPVPGSDPRAARWSESGHLREKG